MEIICFTLKQDAEEVLGWIRGSFKENVSTVKIEKFIPFSDDYDFISKDNSNIASIQIDTRVGKVKDKKSISKEYSSLLNKNDKIISFIVSLNGNIISWGHGSLGLETKDLSYEEKTSLEELKAKLENNLKELEKSLKQKAEDTLLARLNEADELKDSLLKKESDLAKKKEEIQNLLEKETKALAKEKASLESDIRYMIHGEYQDLLQSKFRSYADATKECVRREQELTTWTQSFKENFYCFLIGLSMLTLVIPLVVYFGKKIRVNHLKNTVNSDALDSIHKNDRMSMLRMRYSPMYSYLDEEVKLQLSETIVKDEIEEMKIMEAQEWDNQLKEKEKVRLGM